VCRETHGVAGIGSPRVAPHLGPLQEGPRKPEDPESPVHPRKFAAPGGVGVTRGWYVWRSWNPETWKAEVSNEQSGEKYTVRVLPWMTTYRHLAYGAHPGDLFPGERVNLFFSPEGALKRAYLVHYQDEIGQMQGHKHAWQIEEVAEGGRGFRARVMHGEEVFDPTPGVFVLDPACRLWRDGKKVDRPALAKGDRIYLTWCYEGERRVVRTLSDAASLEAIQAEGQKAVRERLARDGMGAFVEEVANGKTRLLIFSTHWAQAAAIQKGQTLALKGSDAAYRPTGDAVELCVESRKNLGPYGSGPSEVILDQVVGKKAEVLEGWKGGKVIRVFVGK
jgi:hypothetical protein